jgi:hypothetical protein
MLVMVKRGALVLTARALPFYFSLVASGASGTLKLKIHLRRRRPPAPPEPVMKPSRSNSLSAAPTRADLIFANLQ